MSEHALSFKTPEGEAEFVAAYDANLSLWTVPYESFYVSTRFGRTHIVASGPKDAPPVIFLNGFGFGAPMWYPNIGAISRNYRTYVIDVIGEFNKSVMTRPFKEKRNCAVWLCDVLDELNIEKATVIGHSNGGWHTLNFAINAPERVHQMVLLAPAASFVPFHKQFFIRQGAVNLLRTRPVVIDFFCKWFIAKGNEAKVNESLFEQFYVGLKHFKWTGFIIPSVFKEEQLKQIDVPTLLLIGDKEVIYDPHKALNRAKQVIPHIESEIIPNASHVLSIEQAEVVNERILKFLDDHKD